MITPIEFMERMEALRDKYGDDPEAMHREMDKLMATVMTLLGYGQGVAIYNTAEKWYS